MSDEIEGPWRTLVAKKLTKSDQPALDEAIDWIVRMNMNDRKQSIERAIEKRHHLLLGWIAGGLIAVMGGSMGFALMVVGAIGLITYSSIRERKDRELQKACDKQLLRQL